VAQEMRYGSKLYQDVWDHKPPLLFLPFVIIQDIFGTAELPIRLFAVFLHFLDTLILFSLVQRFDLGYKTAWFTICSYVCLLFPPYFQTWTPQAELLMQPFLLGSFLLAYSGGVAAWIGAGILWALAFFIKPTALFFIPLFLFLIGREKLKPALFFILGADSIALTVVAPFILDGRLPLFGQALWAANQSYVSEGWHYFLDHPFYELHVLSWHGTIALAYGIPLILSLFFVLKQAWGKNQKFNREYVFVTTWLLLAILSCFISGYFHPYYYFMVIPPLAIVFGSFLESSRKIKKGLAVSVSIISVFFLLLPWLRVCKEGVSGIKNSEYFQDRSNEAKEIGLYLCEKALPENRLMVWASEAQIYTYSGLKMAVVKSALGTNSLATPELWNGLKDIFIKIPPDYVVISRFDQLPIPPSWLSEEIENNYTKERRWDHYDLFVRLMPKYQH